ncbi:MAG: zinc-binding alcohol dehydrogenase family protein [Myxococcaceae bacterium]
MKAAVVTSFKVPPKYSERQAPKASSNEELVVDVVASALHPRVRSQADGSHYTSTGQLPLVPGIDGVGRDRDGRLRYFVLDDTPAGALAEQTVIERRRSIVLPSDCDPVTIAAAMNPAMGSWLALRCRIPFKKKQNVLVLGATGSAGRMAVQVARHLGAGQIVAVGRQDTLLEKLPSLGATSVAKLGDPALSALCREVDVVLDFVWGEASAQTMVALITARADRSRPVTWVEIGSVSSPTAPIPSAALRAARLQIVGSGIGSVPGNEIVDELPALVKQIAKGVLRIDARSAPLSQVEREWALQPSDTRIVFVPRT